MILPFECFCKIYYYCQNSMTVLKVLVGDDKGDELYEVSLLSYILRSVNVIPNIVD